MEKKILYDLKKNPDTILPGIRRKVLDDTLLLSQAGALCVGGLGLELPLLVWSPATGDPV
jgi:hypothetical protein